MKRPKARERFLEALRRSGVVRYACHLAHLPRRTAYHWRSTDPEFAARWSDALEDACDDLEEEVRRRAVEGVEKPVFYNGRQVGTVRKYSDVLLIFLMKARRPEKFRERSSVEHSGPGEGPVPYRDMDPDERRKRIAELLAKTGHQMLF